MILLDTNALIWLDAGHRRTRTLGRSGSLYVSPATLMELQFLQEAGRLRLRGQSLRLVVDDDRWLVDDPPALEWLLRACDLGWTCDPFDRLLVAHARLRGWRLATADSALLARLAPGEAVEL